MKQFILLYDQIVPGHGLFKAGTVFNAIREDSKCVYVKFEGEEGYANELVHRFSKTHIVPLTPG